MQAPVRSPAALLIAVAAIGLGLSACSDVPTIPATATRTAQRSDLMPEANVVQSVTGAAHLRSEARDGAITFHMFRRADGSVDGWVRHESLGPGGARLRVRIECLRISGTQAWATGVVVYAAGPQNIGRPYSYRFIDHGEGVDSAPDEYGSRRFEALDCMSEPDIETRPLIMGNLKIRP